MIFKKKQWNSDSGLASEVSRDIFGVLTLTNCLISSCSTLYYSST